MKQYYFTEAEIQALKDEIKTLSEINDAQRKSIRDLEYHLNCSDQLYDDALGRLKTTEDALLDAERKNEYLKGYVKYLKETIDNLTKLDEIDKRLDRIEKMQEVL